MNSFDLKNHDMVLHCIHVAHFKILVFYGSFLYMKPIYKDNTKCNSRKKEKNIINCTMQNKMELRKKIMEKDKVIFFVYKLLSYNMAYILLLYGIY